MINIYTDCPVCQKKKKFDFIMSVKNINWKNIKEKKFSYYQCSFCKFWVIIPKLSKEDKEIIYKGNYYTNLATPIKNSLLSKLFKVKIFSSYRDFVIANSSGKKLLDIGCGAGDFLAEMIDSNFEAYGIDPYPDAVKKSRKLAGEKNVKLGSISSLNKSRTCFDVITMWHVLEHTDKPFEDLLTIFKKLNNKGKLFIEVPNSDSFNLRLFSDNYAWHMVPEHHYYFNPKSISILLKKTGFKINKVYTPPRALLNFSFSIKNSLSEKKFFSSLAFFASIPVSIFLTTIFSLFKKGEVVRVIAERK